VNAEKQTAMTCEILLKKASPTFRLSTVNIVWHQS